MKNFRKIVAVLSAVLMLCSVIPMGAMVSAAPATLYYADFENGTLGGWQNDAGGMSLVPTSELPVANAACGNYVVKKVKPAGDWGFLEDRAGFAVEPNTDYMVTVDVMPVANQNYPLQAYVSTGTWINGILGTSGEVKCTNNKWTTLSFIFNSGENTNVYASIKSTWDNCTYYFDNFKVAEVDPHRDVVTNGGFETGDLTGWNTHETVTVEADAAHDGNYGVHMKDRGTWGGIMDQTVAVEAGKTYEVSFWIKVNKFGVNLQIKDGSSSGASLVSGGTWFDYDHHSDWTQKTFTVTPSTNAIFFNFCGGGGAEPDASKVTDTYVDSFTVRVPREPSYDGYLYNGDFETGKLGFGTAEVTTLGAWYNLWGSTSHELVAGYNSDYALKGTAAGAYNITYQNIPVEPNTDYIVTAWAKDASKSALWVKNAGGKGDITNKNFAAGSDWQLNVLGFNSGSNTTVWIGLMGVEAGGTYTVDNVKVVKAAPVSNDDYLSNTNFEGGSLNHWQKIWSTQVDATIIDDGCDSAFAVKVIGKAPWGQLRQQVTVEPNTDYKVTLWAKDVNGMSVLIKESADINNILNTSINAGEEWTEVSVTFNSGDNALVYVGVMVSDDMSYGTFDNFLMEKVVCEHEYDDCSDLECNLCGEAREFGHNLTYSPAKDAIDCANPGNVENWYCSECGEYFADAECTTAIAPWNINITVDCVRPEGIADCANVICETCGNEIYGYGEHDVLICQGGICSKCNAEIEGVGCQNYDTPACQDGVCYYCGGFVAGFGHENGAWAPCLDGECAYGCGLTYPATEDHVDADANDYCDTCYNHLAHIDEDANGFCDSCWIEMPAAEIVYGDANGDGSVNVRDVILLQQFIANWNVTMDEVAADANADGSVNVRDVILLQQFIANWNVTLG